MPVPGQLDVVQALLDPLDIRSGGWDGILGLACTKRTRLANKLQNIFLVQAEKGMLRIPHGGRRRRGCPGPRALSSCVPRPFSLFQSLQPPSCSCVHCRLLGPVPPHLLHFVMLKNSSAGYFPILSLIPPNPALL